MLARFSEAFLVLKAQEGGFKIEFVPLVMAVMSVAYVVSSYPAGVLSDRFERRYLLYIGLILLVCADFSLANAASYTSILFGAVLWGFHMGFSQGVLGAMVADTAPADKRGSAFGFFNLFSGVAMLFSSVLAGWLWQSYGSAFTFYSSAIFAMLSLILMFIKR